MFSQSLTLQQLQAGAASCADMADLIFCVPLGAAGGSVAPTWTQTHIILDLKVHYNILKRPLPQTLGWIYFVTR